MPAGKYFALNTTSKKKVLSNKSLTRQVRSLKGTEGNRTTGSELLYNAVTLTAGTADINYFANQIVYSNAPLLLHSVDIRMKFLCATSGGATVRVMFCFDERHSGTELTASDIFYTGTDTNSLGAYHQENTRSIKSYKNKNLDVSPRCAVIRDILISLNQNEPKVVSLKIPMYNRKLMDSGTVNKLKPSPFMLLLADEANVTASVSYSADITKLAD